MILAEVLAATIGMLDGAGVPFMITGSLASSYYGEPRSTRDIDIVIDADAEKLDRLVSAIEGAGWYVDSAVAHEALRERSQFNAIASGGDKIDFIVRRDRPFSIEEFGRRRRVDLLGRPGFIVSVEDLIIAKLEWAAETESERQLRDVRSMLDVGRDAIDSAYVAGWVARLGLEDAWRVASQPDAPSS